MWKPAVSGMEEAHIVQNLSNRRIRRYLVCRLKRPEARGFSHVRFTGFFQLVKQITSSERDIMGERYSVQKLTFHLFISYLLYMSGSQRTVLIQKGDCSRNKKQKKQIRRITYLRCVSRYNSFFNKQSLVVTLSLLLLILLLTGSNNLQGSALICHNL